VPTTSADIEPGFAAALFDRGQALPRCIDGFGTPRAQRGFEVYRNNYRVNLRDTLQASYPVTAQLVGEEFFAAMANVFVTTHPPRSPVLIEYGAEFPAFIDGFEPAKAVPYLADVARLETCWNDAYYAPEAEPVDAEAMQQLSAAALAASQIRLHPSLRLLHSSYPVTSIWAAHQPLAPKREISWEPEDALIVRPDAHVLMFTLKPGYLGFINALRTGEHVEQAALQTLENVPTFDAGLALVDLFAYGAVTALK
jgi:Putative DNA-binding domain